MKTLKTIAIVLAVVVLLPVATIGLLGGCGAQNQVVQGTDEFTGAKTTGVRNLQLNNDNMFAGIRLDIVHVDEGGQKTFGAQLMYRGTSWLHAREAQWLVDGDRVQFKGRRDSNVINSQVVEELFFFTVPRDFLTKISRASEVKVRLQGSDGSIVGVLEDDHKQAIASFLKTSRR